MKLGYFGAACALVWMLSGGAPVLAQGAAAPGASSSQTADDAKPARRGRSSRGAKRSTKEPTVGQMAARERQKKCGAEWREAKAAGKTGKEKWPQYWSKCNARLKGNSA